jgi:NitT/TauT family transport system substrate-binding protein
MAIRQKSTSWLAWSAITPLLFYGFAIPAIAQTPTTVRVNIVPISDLAPLFAGIREGFFKEEGLDVSLQTSQGGGAIGIPALVAEAYDIVFTNAPSAILAVQQGINIRAIAAPSVTFRDPPENVGLLARASDRLDTGKSMEGRSIGVNARNNINWLLARTWVKRTGGDADKVEFREVPIPQSVDALKAKQVDAVLIPDPFLTLGKRDLDLSVVGWPMSSFMPENQPGLFVVTADFSEKRADVVKKFIQGFRRGAEWVNANVGKDTFHSLLNTYTRLDPALLSSMRIPRAVVDVDADSLRRWAALMREEGLLKADVDVRSLLHTM